MNQSVKEIAEEFIATYEDFRHNTSKITKILITLLRWLLVTVLPIYFGAYLSVLLEKYIDGTLIITWVNIYHNWPFFASGLLFIIGLLWRIYISNRELRLERLYHSLRWFYDDMGFGKDVNADVRCTIWTPINSKVEPDKMKIVQLVDYVPKYGKSAGLTYWYRINKHSGRIRKVAKAENGIVKPIGIAGRCVIQSARDNKPYIMYENLNASLSFSDCMMQVWNFTKAETRRLTQDRKSYLCIVLMDSGQTDILGIIFADSRQLNYFTQRIANKAENYLPRIAELLVD